MIDKVKNVIAGVFKIPLESINENTSPDTVENWDSIHHMNLILALEEAFDLKLTEEQITQMLNFPLILEILKEINESHCHY